MAAKDDESVSSRHSRKSKHGSRSRKSEVRPNSEASSSSPLTPRAAVPSPSSSSSSIPSQSSSSSAIPPVASSSAAPSSVASSSATSSSVAPSSVASSSVASSSVAPSSAASSSAASGSDILTRLFAAPPTFDLTFHVGKESLHAHTFVINARCPSFFAKTHSFVKLRDKGKGREKRTDAVVSLDEEVPSGGHSGVSLTISEVFSAAVLRKLLDYLYFDQAPLADAPAESVLYLLVAAAFLSLDRLVWQCETRLRHAVDYSNILSLLKIADRYRQDSIKSLCLDWVFANYDPFLAMIMSLNESQLKQELGLPLFLHVVYQYRQFEKFERSSTSSTSPPADSPYPLFRHTAPSEPPSTLAADLESLLGTPVAPDVHARFADNGQHSRVAFHSAIVGLASAQLFKFVASKPVDDDFSGLVTQKSHWHIGADAFRSALRFLYLNDHNIDPLLACQLASFAQHWGWDALHQAVTNVVQTAISVERVLPILCITYDPLLAALPFYVDLRARCLAFCCDHFAQLDLAMLRVQPARLSADILVALQRHCSPSSPAFPIHQL